MEPRPAERPWAATDRQGRGTSPRPIRPVPTARRAGLPGCPPPPPLRRSARPRAVPAPPRPASQLPVTASVPAGSGGEGRKSPAPLRSASPRPLRPRYPGTCARSGAGGQRWVEAARPFPPPLRGVRWCGPSALAPRPHPPIAGRGGRIHPSRDRLLTRRLATTRWRWRRVSAGCGPAPLLCGATSSAVLLARLLWAYRKAIHPKKRVIPMKVP